MRGKSPRRASQRCVLQFPDAVVLNAVVRRNTKFMRCAKGICAKGFGGCTRFSLLRRKKGSETPSCGGKKGV